MPVIQYTGMNQELKQVQKQAIEYTDMSAHVHKGNVVMSSKTTSTYKTAYNISLNDINDKLDRILALLLEEKK
jgi:hypothetical protein